MIIHDLNFVGVVVPLETKAELVVYANAPLAGPVASQRFQSITGRGPQVIQPPGLVQHLELAQRHSLDALQESGALPGVPEGLRVSASERAYHPHDIIANR